MDNETIDYGSWSVPTRWEDVTLKTYQEIERYYEDKDKDFDIREVLHIFTNHSEDEINALPVEFLEEIMTHLVFLQTKPEEKEPTNKITINGEEYSINFMEKLKTGEYVAADMAMKSDKHDYASFLAILCRKQGEVYDSKFEAEVFEERRKMFEQQPVVNILPIISFFLSLYVQLQTPFLLYTKVEEAINHIQQNIDNSDKIGPFRRYCMNLRMKRLRKSLESASSTSRTRSHSLRTLLRKAKWKRRKTHGKK
jgi:hypothetical protein